MTYKFYVGCIPDTGRFISCTICESFTCGGNSVLLFLLGMKNPNIRVGPINIIIKTIAKNPTIPAIPPNNEKLNPEVSAVVVTAASINVPLNRFLPHL